MTYITKNTYREHVVTNEMSNERLRIMGLQGN